MDTTTLIGLGLSAALLLKQNQSEDDLKNQIDNLQKDLASQESYFEDKLKDADKSSDEYIKKYVQVYPICQFSKISYNTWIGRFSICIENKSQDKTFLAFKEKAVFSLCGQRCINFQPGMHDQFTLSPGAVVYADATWQNKSWFSNEEQREIIQNKLRSKKDYWWSDGELVADITIAFGTIGDFNTTKITWENVKGRVKLESGAIHNYDNRGFNCAKEDW